MKMHANVSWQIYIFVSVAKIIDIYSALPGYHIAFMSLL